MPFGMPGMGGGMPPMAGDMTPAMGQSPFGAPPPAAMSALDQLTQAPNGDGESQALTECSTKLKSVSGRIIMRSPRAAQELAKAVQSLDRAQEFLQEESGMPVGMPPDLLGQMTPSPQGGGGGGMF